MKLVRKIRIITLFVHLAFSIAVFLCSESQNQNTLTSKAESTNQSKSTEKINLKTKIFLESNILKHKKSAAALKTFVSTTQPETKEEPAPKPTEPVAAEAVKPETGEAVPDKSKKETATQGAANSSPVLFEGWVKYFKFSETINKSLPKKFFKNGEYNEQMKLYPGVDYAAKNPKGEFEYIKSPDYFYIVAFKNIVSIFSSKQQTRKKLIDSFTINEIRPLYEDDEVYEKGGLLKFGNFNEGFCFKILTRGAVNYHWVVCLDEASKMQFLMQLLRKLKLEEQRQDGIILYTTPKKQTKATAESLVELLGSKKAEKGKSPAGSAGEGTSADGYWITINEWTECSLKCGGGVSTLQRACIPPKNAGKPCIGNAILTKKCNTKPCPEIKRSNSTLSNGNDTVKKPIIKLVKFSNFPQRFVKCKIKESDLMLYQNLTDPMTAQSAKNLLSQVNLEGLTEITVPVRILMNNETISVYTGDSYESLYMSFKLKNVRFLRHAVREDCFVLKETEKKKVNLCSFSPGGGCKKEIDEWDYDFHLFKNQCSVKPQKYLDVSREFKIKLAYKIKEAEEGLKLEEQEAVKKKRRASEKSELNSIVKKTNNVALQALQKEISLEQMIQQEEEERIKSEEEQLKKNIENEKKKKECVLKAIKERELENQYNTQAKEIEQTINNIKQETAQQVLIRRNNLKKIIEKLRQKHDLKKNKLQQELQSVKISIASEIGKHYKKGDLERCQAAAADNKKRNEYCLSSFSEDAANLNYCKSTEEFCNFCCENEISELFVDERIKCVKTVCGAQYNKRLLEDTLDSKLS